MRGRLIAALACYAVLAIAAALILHETTRFLVWLFLGALAVKTWIAEHRR